MTNRFWIILLLFAGLTACQRESAPAPRRAESTGHEAASAVEPNGADLKDVIEHDPRYVIGISYPPGAAKYPGLAIALRRFADTARADLMETVQAEGSRTPTTPYELSLNFSLSLETPRIVAVAADGNVYTGGAHSNPIIARFIWLPQAQKMLQVSDLIIDKRGWNAVSDYVREELHAALSQRIDADDLPAAERAALIRSSGKMIDEGSQPSADTFDQFEPVLDGDNNIIALRFVFPPYQVGPYADGTQTVEVPLATIRPYLAPAYLDLFARSEPPA